MSFHTCGICGALVAPDQVEVHALGHKALEPSNRAPSTTGPASPGEQGEHVVIEDGAESKRLRDIAARLQLNTETKGTDLVVYGDRIDEFLAEIDPNVWDPEHSRGDT